MTAKKHVRAAVLTLTMVLAVLPVSAAAQELVAGGRAVGIQMTTDGVVVAGVCQVETESGSADPAGDAGLAAGDVITRLGKTEIHTSADFMQAVSALDGSPVSVTVSRNGETKQFTITPAKAADGKLRQGLWLRDGVTGVGTLTFYDPETGVFGALGHGITDTDTGVLLPLSTGAVSDASITGVEKSSDGKPGQLDGSADVNKICGSILMNTDYGIFGIMDGGRPDAGAMECGEVKPGKATILTTISGQTVGEYAANIDRVYHDADGDRVLITVTDKTLLDKTGGIVQGMSGSPIIQDGRLVGAVTHVLVNDPAKGYGLSIQDMIAAAQACADKAA